MWLRIQRKHPTNLEEEGVAQGVAEAEDEVLLGVLGHGLHDAVLHPHGVLGDAGRLDAQAAVALVEKQRAPCGRNRPREYRERAGSWVCEVQGGKEGAGSRAWAQRKAKI